MRSLSPVLRVAVSAALCAVLAACGESETDERQFIAQSRAEQLLRSVDRIESGLSDGECEDAAAGVARLRGQIQDLPDSYDTGLVSNLSQWVDHLDDRAQEDCTDAEAEPTVSPDPTPSETASPSPTATSEPTETPTPSPSPTASPTPTVPGTAPEPPDNGGVSPGDDDG